MQESPVALNQSREEFDALTDAIGAMRTVPLDCDTVRRGKSAPASTTTASR
jgi:hypothetical protein